MRSTLASLSTNFHRAVRRYHDYIRYPTSQGRTLRLSLAPGKIFGLAVSRGNREHQEDSHAVVSINIPHQELRTSLRRDFGVSWNPGISDTELASQVLFVGLYDGHGGSAITQYLQANLHTLFETVDKKEAKEVVDWLKGKGGYFKRFRGGALEEWVRDIPSDRPLDLEARATLAFLQADLNMSNYPESERSGATASVAILQSIELPAMPFFASRYLALTVAHCGDTRVILCSTESGKAFPMTENHHAETRGEAARLRKLGTGLVTDSFGEARWMGALANTRGLGDSQFKPFGVTPEPEIKRRILRDTDWAFLAFVSDGISSLLSDDEIVDLARGAESPQAAAQTILAFAQEMGSEDNASVIVIPLAGWGSVKGVDKTKDLREYRRKQAVGSERQRRM